jgi:hypothetical protein
MAPKGCAVSYRFYSLIVHGGERGVTPALDAFAKQAAVLTGALPAPLRSFGATYALVGKTRTSDELARVERSNTPITVALAVLAVAAALVTIVIAGLLLARELGRSRDEQLAWWRLGMTSTQRARVVVVPLLAATIAGLVVSVPGAWLLSPVAPIGVVRSIDPSPARSLSSWAWPVVAFLALAYGALVAVFGWRSSRRMRAREARHRLSAARRLFPPTNRPAFDDGVHAAYATRRGSGFVAALAASAVAVLLAAGVFGSSLSALIATPSSYGWPWDIGMIGNYGYGGLHEKAIGATLDHDADVESWTALGFSNAIQVDRAAIPAILAFGQTSERDVAVVRGRLPRTSREVALGADTAADLDLGIGDSVHVEGFEVVPTDARVTGTVVLPALGPFQGDRAAPGRGVLVPNAMLTKDAAAGALTFVGVRFRPDVDEISARDAISRASPRWAPKGFPITRYAKPVRPAEILNARSVRRAPLLVAALLVLAATIGLTGAIFNSVRSRRHDLAVLRTLGFTARQLRQSVRVQALATVLGGVAIGVPLGLIAGRLAWQAFAFRLGVVTSPSTPIAWIAATIVGGIVAALLAAAIPARIAARATPATRLHAE